MADVYLLKWTDILPTFCPSVFSLVSAWFDGVAAGSLGSVVSSVLPSSPVKFYHHMKAKFKKTIKRSSLWLIDVHFYQHSQSVITKWLSD